MVRVLWLRVVAKEAEVGSTDGCTVCLLLLIAAAAAAAAELEVLLEVGETELVLGGAGVVVDLEVLKPVNKVLVVCGGLLATPAGEAWVGCIPIGEVVRTLPTMGSGWGNELTA